MQVDHVESELYAVCRKAVRWGFCPDCGCDLANTEGCTWCGIITALRRIVAKSGRGAPVTAKFSDGRRTVYTDAPFQIREGSYQNAPELEPWVGVWLGACAGDPAFDDGLECGQRYEIFDSGLRVEPLDSASSDPSPEAPDEAQRPALTTGKEGDALPSTSLEVRA